MLSCVLIHRFETIQLPLKQKESNSESLKVNIFYGQQT